MAADSYNAVWVSHTSIGDFRRCPRAYFLKNIYRDKKTGHKIKIVSAPLSLGQIIHEVLESLSTIPTEERLKESLIVKLHTLWEKISGRLGGFTNKEMELRFKKRGEEMLSRVMEHPGPLAKKAVRIKSDMDIIHYWLSEKDNIILCGKIDWLEYIQEFNSVHIIDFKTSKNEEDSNSLQLPIYYLLAKNCQNRVIDKASYWYIERNNEPTEKKLPDPKEAYTKVFNIAKKIKLARQLNVFKCPYKIGCGSCRPMEKIIKGEAQFVGIDERGNDMYILEELSPEKESEVL
ncbi:PD-(D/E)XK nuclease family protein [Candidatus Roizmanbacteria bacterium]|nr:PD-(D/E)XK nuclease family protein [Candidatus Roizmanbacteria bacterium]